MRNKFYYTTSFLAFFVLFSACKNKQSTPQSTAPAAKGLVQCFQLNQNKDLTTCQIITDEKGFVKGYMDWSPFEKDGGHGILKNGILEGNMLTADWAYSIEGSVQTEEVYLKIDADKVTQMRGELTEDKSGRLVAKDKTKLTAGDILPKVECAQVEQVFSNIEAMPNIAECYAPPKPPTAPLPNDLQILIACDERGNMTWGDKPIKDFNAFKKLMTAELSAMKKQGVNPLPNIKTEGCLMGASGELRTLFEEIKTDILNPKKPNTNKGDNKTKPNSKPKPVPAPAPPPKVTQYENGTIKLNGKEVKFENLRKELQAVLLTYKVIPDKVTHESVGTVTMGIRGEAQNIIDESIAGAKWVRKKAALEAIKIETFSKFPPEIDGCSCYFSNSKGEIQAKKYIYADNFGKIAFVRINGVTEKLTLKKTSNKASAKNVKNLAKQEIKTYANDKYEITINIEQTGGLEEVWYYKGKMTIKNKNGQVVIKDIVGECGC